MSQSPDITRLLQEQADASLASAYRARTLRATVDLMQSYAFGPCEALQQIALLEKRASGERIQSDDLDAEALASHTLRAICSAARGRIFSVARLRLLEHVLSGRTEPTDPWLRELLRIPADGGTQTAGHLGDRWRVVAPVFLGDTLHVRHKPLAVRRTRSQPTKGVMTYGLQLVNQRDEIVQQAEVDMMLDMRDAG